MRATNGSKNFFDNDGRGDSRSHDRYFLDRVTNRTLELYFGTVDDYSREFHKYLNVERRRLLVQSEL